MHGVLLVTGGARGIGAATVHLAAAQGYAVAVNYRAQQAAAEALVSEIAAAGGRAIAVRADMARQDRVERMFAAVDEQLGRLSALVNSAGIDGGPPTARAPARGQRDLDHALLPGGGARDVDQLRRRRRRDLQSLFDGLDHRRPAGRSAYAASKAAVDAFMVGFAREVAREGAALRGDHRRSPLGASRGVSALRSGMTFTDMSDAVRGDPDLQARIAETIAMNRCALPEEIARPILWLLSDAASFVSGTLLDASGGGFMLAPRALP
jgi:NAD(P)-dependent dehydrogenase (short-subunit alcohol dehydrogenase family)